MNPSSCLPPVTAARLPASLVPEAEPCFLCWTARDLEVDESGKSFDEALDNLMDRQRDKENKGLASRR